MTHGLTWSHEIRPLWSWFSFRVLDHITSHKITTYKIKLIWWMHSKFSTLCMLCNAYDDMLSFNARSKHQRCYTIFAMNLLKRWHKLSTCLPIFDLHVQFARRSKGDRQNFWLSWCLRSCANVPKNEQWIEALCQTQWFLAHHVDVLFGRNTTQRTHAVGSWF